MLTDRQRQVLAYLGAWIAEEGYLPTTRAVAAACGLRSPSTAGTVMAELEALGYVVRDRDHPRLATVRDDAAGTPVPAVDELLLCELTIVEIEGSILSAQHALTIAPDHDAIEALHRRCLERLGLLRAYREARNRVEAMGATLTPDAAAAVVRHQFAVAERNRWVTTWDEYRVHVLLLDTLVNRFLEQTDSFGATHIAVAYAAERGVRPHRRLELDEVDRRLRDGDPRLAGFATAHAARLIDDCSTLLGALPESLSSRIGAAAARALADADTQRSQLARPRTPSSACEHAPQPLAQMPGSRASARHAN